MNEKTTRIHTIRFDKFICVIVALAEILNDLATIFIQKCRSPLSKITSNIFSYFKKLFVINHEVFFSKNLPISEKHW